MRTPITASLPSCPDLSTVLPSLPPHCQLISKLSLKLLSCASYKSHWELIFSNYLILVDNTGCLKKCLLAIFSLNWFQTSDYTFTGAADIYTSSKWICCGKQGRLGTWERSDTKDSCIEFCATHGVHSCLSSFGRICRIFGCLFVRCMQ